MGDSLNMSIYPFIFHHSNNFICPGLQTLKHHHHHHFIKQIHYKYY